MIKRKITDRLIELLEYYPSINLVGPRQVGKTTLAKSIIPIIRKDTIHIDLELSSGRKILEDAELFLMKNENKLVIIDEIQLMPKLFSLLRALIDMNRIPGRFLLLGSSSPHLIKKATQSLAGRIAYLDLHPVNLTEIEDFADKDTHWLRGGFPNSLLAKSDSEARNWLENLVRNYVERDLSMLGLDVMPVMMQRFWEMLAHFHGGIWNSSSFARAFGVTYMTVKKYLDFMEGAFLVRTLYPYHFNIKKKLSKSPKVYVRDTGILHYLNNVSDLNELLVNVLIGASWEGYVIEQIAQLCPSNLGLFYYRTHQGSEMDLVLTKALNPVASVEIKFTVAPSLSKGNTIALQDIGTKNNFIIYYGNEEYKQRKDLIVCSLEIFLTKYLPEIINN